MKNADVVSNFIQGNDNCKGSNLYSENGKLINYKTVIALRHPMGLVLNGQSYSRTTSVHQNQIRYSGVEYIETTEKGIKEMRDTGNTSEDLVFCRNDNPLEEEYM